jgi:transglutaminase-like putative cysteine protease
MKHRSHFILIVAMLVISSAARAAPDQPKSREFLFTYQATITGLSPDQSARIWIPVPPTNDEQTVKEIERSIPGEVESAEEPKYHNRILSTSAKPDSKGVIAISVVYRVLRHEVLAKGAPATQPSEADGMYLLADARVPVGGKALRLIQNKKMPADQLQRARVLYDVVADHMTYRKDKPGYGNGDSDWACDSGFGNCTDFHSLFISLARSQEIPAKFEMGFPLPPERGEAVIPGYHCWSKFKAQGHDWIPVDISEASKHPELREYYFGNLTEDRVMFSTGRDITLAPKQAGEPLNFFIYPYVEVDNKIWPADKIKKNFKCQDVASPASGHTSAR